MPELKDQVLKRVHECSITPTFAMLLIAYDDPTKRMEAYYWDADRHKEVRTEKLADAFDLKRYEAESLSRVFEAAK